MKTLLRIIFRKRHARQEPIPLLRHYLTDFNSRNLARFPVSTNG